MKRRNLGLRAFPTRDVGIGGIRGSAYVDPVVALAQVTMSELYPIMIEVGAKLEPARDDRERCGLYFVMMDADDGSYISIPVGTLNMERWPKYRRFALEKARRLREHLSRGDVSSFQSRNEAKERWGGAIVTGRKRQGERRTIFSASALPERGDETFDLIMAIRLGYMKPKRAMQIAAISNNPYLEPWLLSKGLIDPKAA